MRSRCRARSALQHTPRKDNNLVSTSSPCRRITILLLLRIKVALARARIRRLCTELILRRQGNSRDQLEFRSSNYHSNNSSNHRRCHSNSNSHSSNSKSNRHRNKLLKIGHHQLGHLLAASSSFSSSSNRFPVVLPKRNSSSRRVPLLKIRRAKPRSNLPLRLRPKTFPLLLPMKPRKHLSLLKQNRKQLLWARLWVRRQQDLRLMVALSRHSRYRV